MSEGGALADAVERVVTGFAEVFPRKVWLDRDRALGAPLAMEVRPVAEALLEGLTQASRIEPDAPELREAFTLASLLGRRAGVLGATPTAAMAIVPSLLDAASEADERAALLAESLRSVVIEGYIVAREERLAEEAARGRADAVVTVELARGCLAIFLGGAQDPAELDRVLDELGRRMLDRDARACVVHIGALRDASPELARHVFSANATAMMLGARCIFTGVSPAWVDAAKRARVDLAELTMEPDFAAGVRAALDLCGLELRPRAGLGDVLRRFVTSRRSR